MAVEWWLSSQRMTVRVDVDAGSTIVRSAPIVRTFVGQPLRNLVGWMKRQGGFRQQVLSPQQKGE